MTLDRKQRKHAGIHRRGRATPRTAKGVPMAQIVAIGYAMLEERTDWNLRLGFTSVNPC